MSLFGGDPSSFFSALGEVTLLGSVSKFAVSFPLVYHSLGGLRHFYWDNSPETLTNQDVESSSYILLGASVAVSVLAMFA
jgi:succinate dehydrogenase (ubiquinone) cytochrome b560 subunit